MTGNSPAFLRIFFSSLFIKKPLTPPRLARLPPRPHLQTKPVAVAGKGPKSAAAKKAKKGVAVGRAKVQVKAVTAVRRTSVKAVGAAAKAAKAAKKAKTPPKKAKTPPKKAAAPKPKPKKAPAAKKPAPAPKKAPKKANTPKKVKPEPPKPEDLDKDLDSYMAAAPVGDAMTA